MAACIWVFWNGQNGIMAESSSSVLEWCTNAKIGLASEGTPSKDPFTQEVQSGLSVHFPGRSNQTLHSPLWTVGSKQTKCYFWSDKNNTEGDPFSSTWSDSWSVYIWLLIKQSVLCLLCISGAHTDLSPNGTTQLSRVSVDSPPAEKNWIQPVWIGPHAVLSLDVRAALLSLLVGHFHFYLLS